MAFVSSVNNRLNYLFLNEMEEIQVFVDEGLIRCICGIIDDDGFTIQCERYDWFLTILVASFGSMRVRFKLIL